MSHTLSRSRLLLAAALLVSIANLAAAGDYFFTFGGGYSPQGNQISLEKNVLFFQRFLKDLGRSSDPQYYLFADGLDAGRDLQYQEELKEDRLHYLLASLLGNTNDIYNHYRSNTVPHLDGGCSTAAVDQYFDRTSAMHAGDRLMVYFTGHGGKGDGAGAINTVMHFWNGQDIRMKDFVKRLDKVPADVPTVMVMVQCYSGGFANVIFNEGDPTKGLSDKPRAGFFATVHDRVAAGCTPDINEENYQEYSTYFWAALYGQTRTGKKIDKPDYDGDGKTCFAEAHAYALLHSNSIDLSVKTSDALLRQYSSVDPAKLGAQDPSAIITADSDYSKLIAVADPYEKAVLEGLSAQLNLTGEQRTKAARDLNTEFNKQRGELAAKNGTLHGERNGIKGELSKLIKNRWPELNNGWHPDTPRIVTKNAAELTQLIEGHPKFKRYEELATQINANEDQRTELERKAVKCQRFVRAAENTALITNLATVAGPDICGQYTRLYNLERGTLDPAK